MAALLTLEAIGPKGEQLAMAAGEELGIPVGFGSHGPRRSGVPGGAGA